MIRYQLTCDKNHSFDGWFKSAEAFDGLARAGMLSCAQCGSSAVQKALMAPSLGRTQETGTAERPLSQPASPDEKALQELRRQIEENSEYVGMNFAAEARAIHEGDKPGRSIYGEARPVEARKLIEDGIPVAPLPFLPRNRTN